MKVAALSIIDRIAGTGAAARMQRQIEPLRLKSAVLHGLPPGHRLVAIAVSAALAAMMLVPFLAQPLAPHSAAERVTWLRLLPETAESLREGAEAPRRQAWRLEMPSVASTPQDLATQPPAVAMPLPSALEPTPPERSAEAPSLPPLGPAKPAAPASAPLIITPEVIRHASTASKSDVRRMAEASGTSLDSPKLSKHEQLAQDVASSAKPDCLEPGGSLLSVLVIAYQVARDKCK